MSFHPRPSILYSRPSVRSVFAPQQSGEFIDLPCVQHHGVGLPRRFVAAGAIDALVAPFVGMFVLKLHLFQCFGEVAFQAIVARFGGQMFGRSWKHRFGLIPGRQPPQASYDEDDDCDKDQVAELQFHQMLTGFDLYSIYYQRSSDGHCSKRVRRVSSLSLLPAEFNARQ